MKALVFVAGLLLASGAQASFICTGYGYEATSAHHQYRTVWGPLAPTQALAARGALNACVEYGLVACQLTCYAQ